MTERGSGQRRRTWIFLLGAAVVLIVIGVGWRGFSPSRSALIGESQGKPLKTLRLPDDLLGVSDANYASLDGLAPGSREAQERQRQAVQQLGLLLEVKTRKTGIVFRLVPAGSFTMGSPKAEQDAMVKAGASRGSVENETQHQVTLSTPFYCGKFEVTQGQWQMVAGVNPSYYKNAGLEGPVGEVSWEDCQAFAKTLCQMEGVPEGTYRLLTEAEWEYACRAGSASAYCFGDDDSALEQHAWYSRNTGPKLHPVGQKKPNAFGLYDMHGNAWERCLGDIWRVVRGRYFLGRMVPDDLVDPVPSEHADVLRGGGSATHEGYCRSAVRGPMEIPSGQLYPQGVRICRRTAASSVANVGAQKEDDLVRVEDAQFASLDGLAPGGQEAQERQRQAVQRLNLPLEVKTRKTGIVLRLVPAGTFAMGSPTGERGRIADENLQRVTLTNAFYCAKFEVTRSQWEEVMGSNPSRVDDADKNSPVEEVRGEDCLAFVKKLCQIEGVPEGTYRLLTEAEWEYACRAGTVSAYHFGDDASVIGQYAWYYDNSIIGPHRVGQKKANGFGLYDMHGNVDEWCQDRYADYPSGSATDPLGLASGVDRVSRGGEWHSAAWYCRSADRSSVPPHYDDLGLRLARTTALVTPAEAGQAPAVQVPLPAPELKPAQDAVRVPSLVPGQNWVVPHLGMEMVYVKPGSFQMGSNNGRTDEKPVHTVRISRAFWMGKCEVTQSQYEAWTGKNPSHFKGSDLPVDGVYWNDAVAFCRMLTEQERQAGRLPQAYVYRLPTEAEWEYAARGGNEGGGFEYAGAADLDEVAWYSANSGGKPHPVGQKKPNELGLYDMSGNVWELCYDAYDAGYYADSLPSDPVRLFSAGVRVIRGGAQNMPASYCRVTLRHSLRRDVGLVDGGFRVVVSSPLD